MEVLDNKDSIKQKNLLERRVRTEVYLENKIKILKATHDSGIGLYLEELHTLAKKEKISVLGLENILDILVYEGFLQFFPKDQRYVNTNKKYYAYTTKDLNDLVSNYNNYIEQEDII